MHGSPPFIAAALLAATTAWAQTGDWATAHTRAAEAVQGLTNQEKAGVVTGTGWEQGPCVGNTGALEGIGFRSLCLQDGPLGIRFAKPVTVFPAGIQAASTWDVDLIEERAKAIGEEARDLGVNVLLGPAPGALGKIPQAGRNWEGFSPDPYLAGITTQRSIAGIQGVGVQACAKHYIGNEQELNREDISSNIGDRAMHELYLWPFADAVKADVASFMCSYNRLDGTHACENEEILNGLLKEGLNFQGFVMSDWNAQHTTEGSANAGMDMAMPGDAMGDGTFLWGDTLISAVESGDVPQERLDDMVERILAAWYFLGQDVDYPEVTWSSWDDAEGPDVQGDHNEVARAVARDGIVLLKNTNNTLPLDSPESLAIIGQDGFPNPDGPNACVDRGCNVGTLGTGWGSGTAEYPYLIAPSEAIQNQAETDGTTVVTSETDEPSEGASAAESAAVALVFINADSGEGYLTVDGREGDRNSLNAWHNGDDLVAAVAEVNAKTIVVIHSVGPIVLESFIELDNVAAVVWAGLPGQESGNSLVDVLYGSTAPNGKLPYTIGKTEEDHGTQIVEGDDDFTEGLFIDYRHFDNSEIEPRFEFGFGLSYTTFEYADLTASFTDGPPGDGDLFEEVATVTASISNAGSVDGAEVAQLYIGLPASAPSTPPKQLRGFQKLALESGESGPVSFSLRRKDLSYWDTEAQAWTVPEGEFTVSVGASSRDIRLTGTL